MLSLTIAPVGATVVWEDYRGRSGVPGVTTPTVDNYQNQGASATVRQNLRDIFASTASTPTRTGTAVNIDFGLNTTLCNVTVNPASAACLAQAQGRVVHALVRFPAAGLYTLAVAHDDEVEVLLSSDFANTNYAAAVYDIPVGTLGGWTNDVNTFATFGQFNASAANSCALIRMYWSNQGGQNFARLRWTTPGGTTEIIPAASLFDPSLPASATGCNGSVTSTSVALNKTVSGRAVVADQFLVQIASAASGGTVHRSATTSGSGTTAATGAYVATPNATYYLREQMAAGSASPLASYNASIQCTRNGIAFTPAGSAPTWNVTPGAGEQIECTITNASAQSNFGTCNARMFLSQGPDQATNTTLYNVNVAVNPFTFPAIGQAALVYNATGYNPIDNYAYAMRYAGAGLLNQLLRVGADGSTVNLGAVSGLPSQSYNSGAFSGTGTYYVKPLGNNATIYAINVNTLVATPVALTTSFTASDIAFVGGTLYSVSDSGQLYGINPSNGATTAIGTAAGGGLVLGAQFGGPNGLFASANSGGFYQIDLSTGTQTLISGSPTAATNDGANCPTTAIAFPADLAITKTDGQTTYPPGGNVVYTLVASNSGPFGAQGVTVADPLPAGISAASWTCVGAGGGTCGAASGTGAINDANVGLPLNASVTYTLTMQVPAGFTGNLVNTATVTPGAATTDSNLTNNTATDTNTGVPAFDFCAANTIYNHDQTGSAGTFAQRTHVFNTATSTESTLAGLTLPLPGATEVNGLMLDPVTNRLITTVRTGASTSQLWAYDAANGGWYAASPTFTGVVPRAGMNASGVGYLIGSGGTPPVWRVQAAGAFNYSVTSLGSMSYNVAPSDLGSGDLAFDVDGLGWLAVGRDLWTIDFAVTPLQAVRQQRPTFNGSPLAFNLSGIAFGSDGNLYVANSGNPSPASGYYQIDLDAGTIALAGSATNARDLASCAFPSFTPAELEVEKTLATVNGTPYVAGAPVRSGDTLGYAIEITHVGGNLAATLYAGDVVETLPANTTFVAAGNDFACTGSNCPSITDVVIPVGGSTSLDFFVQVNASLPPGLASIDNAVAVNGESPVDCAVNDCVESTPVALSADLSITKSSGGTEVVSGATIDYVIVVTNAGPGNADNALVSDPPPAVGSGLSCSTDPTCSAAGGATCPAALTLAGLQGAGLQIPLLPPGGTVTFGLSCQVTASGQ